MIDNSASPPSLGNFDYIIVGGGPSAMGLLLGLLSSSSQSKGSSSAFTIALIERGGAHVIDTTRDLSRWCHVSHSPKHPANDVYLSTLCNRRIIDVCVGKGVGGTSNINAGLIIPPARDDFTNWPASVREKLFQSIETVVETMHANGCITPSTIQPQPMISRKFPIVDTSKGWKETTVPSLCLHVPCVAGKDKGNNVTIRKNYYEGLIEPLLKQSPQSRDQMQIFTGSFAERLLFKDGICVGVEVLSSTTGQFSTVFAEKEVILAAGSVETPALLLASGIGRKEDLNGIPAAISDDYKGHVGGNLRDHVLLPRVFLTRPRLREPVSLNGVRAIGNLEIECNDDNNKPIKTRAQVSLLDSATYIDSVPQMLGYALRLYVTIPQYPKLMRRINQCLQAFYLGFKSFLLCLIVYTPIYFIMRYSITTVAVFLMNPHSIGKVSVKKKEQEKNQTKRIIRRSELKVEIDLGYFTDVGDIGRMMQAFESSIGTCFFDSGLEVYPGPLIRTLGRRTLDPYRFSIFARAQVLPYFHWMGTCTMQLEDNSNESEYVVDAKFKVRQVQGLRLCDASVFPTLISAPPALTCAALGHVLGTAIAFESKTQKE